MNDYVINSKSFNILKLVCAVNFNAAVIFLLVISVISALGSSIFFEDNSDLYGPMDGNLRLMLIYLCLTEIAVYSYCRFNGNYRGILLLGLFFLLLMVSVDFYAYINQVPVDDNYRWLFLYLGLSHLGYGGLIQFGKEYKS